MSESAPVKLSRRTLLVSTLTILIVCLIAIPAGIKLRPQTRRTDAKNSLKQIGIYFSLYESKFKRFPTSLDDLQRELHLEPAQLVCPRCGHRWSFIGPAGSYAPPGGARYTWGPGGITDAAPPDLPIAACLNCGKPGDDRFVLFFQGRIDVFAVGSPMESAVLNVLHLSDTHPNDPAK